MQAKSPSNVKVIDVSHHQKSINWNLVYADGVKGAFIKASEGKTGIDDKFSSYATGAVLAGLKVGYYHYARPENNSPEDEAVNFYKTVKGFKADFPYVLDVEGEAADLGHDKLTEWCMLWLKEVERLSSHPVMIYTGASFAKTYLGKELSKWPLWIAHYGTDKPMANSTWDKWSVFQYTSTGTVDGISGIVDVNAMEAAFFAKYPLPAPEPTATDNIKVVVNDKLVAYGRVKNGHVYLPIRKLGEALGYTVEWRAQEAAPYIDGKVIRSFEVMDGVTYIGVRAAAELLGGIVSWDNVTKKIYLYR